MQSLADDGKKVGAFFIDWVIIDLVFACAAIAFHLNDKIVWWNLIPAEEGMTNYRFNFSLLFLPIIAVIAAWPYFAFFESSSLKATPGKWIFKIYVADLDGKVISFWRASLRYLELFTLVTLGAVIYIATSTPISNGKYYVYLHDRLCSTRVFMRSS